MSKKTKLRKANIFGTIVIGSVFGILLFLFLKTSYFKKQAIVQYQNELRYWQKQVVNNPGYPDGWVKLATIWYNLDNQFLAERAINKARKLDSIREEIKKIEREIKY